MKTLYKNPVAHTAVVALVAFSCVLSYGQTVDPGFNSPEVLRQAFTVAFAKGAGKKTYIAGDIEFHGTAAVKQLVRVNSDGSRDATFNADLPERVSASVVRVAVLPNENVVVLLSGEVTGAPGLCVLNKYGAQVVAPRFDVEEYPSSIAVLPDNTFLLGGYQGVRRYSSTGDYLNTFMSLVYTGGGDPVVHDVEVVGSKVVIAGNFEYVLDPVTDDSVPRKNLVRYNLDGTLDYGFDASAAANSYGIIDGICVQPDLKVILEKGYRTFDSPVITSMRVNADGSPDTQFNSNYPSTITIDQAHYHNGKITVANKTRIVRLNLDGTLDGAFKPVVFEPAKPTLFVLSDDFVITANYPNAVYGITKISPIGVPSITYKAELTRRGIINSMDRTAVSIYIGGDFIKVNSHFTRNVARLNPNGTVLTKFKVSFDPGEVKQVDGFDNAKALINTSKGLLRLKHDGTFDTGFSFTPFGGLTTVTKFIVQNDGRILIGAPSKLFRINANGTPDNSFNAAVGGFTSGSSFDFDLDRPTGKIIFGGEFVGQPSYATRNITRLNPDGSVDGTFSSQLTFQQYGGIQRIRFLDNLEVMVMTIYNGARQPTKLFANGSVDSDFISNYNTALLNDEFHEHIVRFGDRLVMGSYEFYGQRMLTDAFFEDGQIDTEFSVPVTVGQVYNLYADNDHELFVLGDIDYPGVANPRQIVKILYSAPAPLAAMQEHASVSFYPNPARNFVSISSGDAIVNIYSLVGESKIKAKVTSPDEQIDIRNLPAGHYVIQINYNGQSSKHHLVKE
jgi:uncharacterized delta-60 repeat protein